MPEPSEDASPLVAQAFDLREQVAARPTETALDRASEVLEELRKEREFELLGALAEQVTRNRPKDTRSRRLYAQSLIETGKPSVAVDVLKASLRAAAKDDPERDELQGLLGRAHKQIFMETPESTANEAKAALRAAIADYREPFERDPDKNYWHGINLSALLSAARNRGVRAFRDLDSEQIARHVLDSLDKTPADDRDFWWNATRAEAHIALGDWKDAERALKAYVADDSVPQFNFASTVRQLRDVWEIQNRDAAGAGLLQILEAKLLRGKGSLQRAGSPGGALKMRPGHIRAMREAPMPDTDQLERVLGDTDTVSIRWYRTGLQRAGSVAAVRKILGSRFGTGFAVRAGDFGMAPEAEILVLTNFHVLNREGAYPGRRPESADIRFEAAENADAAETAFRVREVVAESSFDGGLDYALLRLDRPAAGVAALPLTNLLPARDSKARVYLIGHPRGEELQFSLQDNELLDHEGEPGGVPPDSARRRVHYFAPTAGGSSGSPVFDGSWQCVALHHAGRKYAPPDEPGMPKLNGQDGAYSANEGIWIRSVQDHVRSGAGTL